MTKQSDVRRKRIERLLVKGKKLAKSKHNEESIKAILNEDLMVEGLSYNARLDYLTTVLAMI